MSKPRFVINSMDCVTSWSYLLPCNKECTICRESLNKDSLQYQEKGLDSYIITGVCGHSFHNDCIEPWIKKNNKCPICTCKWVKKTIKKIIYQLIYT